MLSELNQPAVNEVFEVDGLAGDVISFESSAQYARHLKFSTNHHDWDRTYATVQSYGNIVILNAVKDLLY